MATSVSRKSVFILAFGIMLILSSGVLSDTYTTSQAEFDLGSYANTIYNSGSSSIQANASTGTYTSKIIDAGQLTNWYEMDWSTSAYGSLADNQQTENFASGNIDMSGNTVLYHLDDALANNAEVKDSSGNENNGTFYTNDASKSTSGKINNAIDFDGNDYIDLTAGIGAYNFTLSMWFKANNVASFPFLYGEKLQSGLGLGYVVLAFLDNGKLTAKYWDDSEQCIAEINSTSAYNDNAWHNVVFTRINETYGELYIDGVLSDSSSFSSAIPGKTCAYKATSSAKIGEHFAGGNYFEGSMDDIAVWSRPLTALEINSIYTRASKNLNLEIRSCDDSSCSGEAFSALAGQSPKSINEDNRYFQYQFNFTGSPSVEVYNVTIQYDSPPTVTLTSPADNYRTLNGNLTLECSATDNNAVINTTLYTDISGTWKAESIGVSSASQSFNSLADGNYTWNCQSYDNNNRMAWASTRNVNAAFDKDQDTVPDAEDSLEGNKDWVKTTGISDIQVTVNDNTAYGTFNGNNEMKFFDGTALLMSFSHDFSPANEIDLSKITINSTSTFFAVDLGSQLLAGESKTIYMPNSLEDICVKDSADANMSLNCSEADEIDFTPCIGNTTGVILNNRSCVDTESRLMISNLTHTAVRITPSIPVISAPSSSSGSSSGGGGRANSWQQSSGASISDASASEISSTAAKMKSSEQTSQSSSPQSSQTSTANTPSNLLTGNVVGSGSINWKSAMFTLLGLIVMILIALGLRMHYYGKKEKPFDPFEEGFIQKIKNRFNNL